MIPARLGFAGLLSMTAVGCARPSPTPWRPADVSTWSVLRASLDEERRGSPRTPWAAGLRVTMHEPRSGRTIDGRGGIAVAPGRAVRMILIGAAGATMLDAWVTESRWRIAVPPLDRITRGGADAPADLPVGFLRWWFFTPLGGTLVAGSAGDGGALWLLREGDAIIELRRGTCGAGELLQATRRAHGRSQRVDQCRATAPPREGPHEGDSVHYLDEGNGLTVDLTIESVAASPPDEEAFRDPESEGRSP